MSLDLILTLAGIVTGVAFAVFCSWRAGRPRDDLKPKMLPWQFLMILSAFVTMMLLVHLINVLGYETGPGKGLLGGRFGG